MSNRHPQKRRHTTNSAPLYKSLELRPFYDCVCLPRKNPGSGICPFINWIQLRLWSRLNSIFHLPWCSSHRHSKLTSVKTLPKYCARMVRAFSDTGGPMGGLPGLLEIGFWFSLENEFAIGSLIQNHPQWFDTEPDLGNRTGCILGLPVGDTVGDKNIRLLRCSRNSQQSIIQSSYIRKLKLERETGFEAVFRLCSLTR
jgi:hypothetical protein